MIQAPDQGPGIMRYESGDYEWSVIRPSSGSLSRLARVDPRGRTGRRFWAFWEGVSQARGCDRRHRYPDSAQATLVASDVEDTMPKIILLIAATALILCSIEVWAGGSRIATTDDAAVFVLSNAL